MKVGFIGLGIMGKPMVRNLIKAGYALYVYDLVAESVAKLSSEGAMGCKNIRELAESCNVIITMLPNGPHVTAVLMGEDGIVNHAKPGTLIVDMSSIAPEVSKELAAELRKKELRLLDAPVSGGEGGAIAGTLSIMVGGDEKDFQEALPLFAVMGSSAMLVGPIGSGNTCKLANQIMVAANIAGGCEALMLAKMAGADVEKVFHAIKGGFASSTAMMARGPKILDGDFSPSFRIDLHCKDLHNSIDTGYKTGTPLPLTLAIQNMFNYLRADGLGNEDHCSLIKYYEKLTGTIVRK